MEPQRQLFALAAGYDGAASGGAVVNGSTLLATTPDASRPP